MKAPLLELLREKKLLVLDGAMATELEKAGVDTANELWSATALLDAPQKITNVHQNYFRAGADIAITNTYQATKQAFMKQGMSAAKSSELIKQAVFCAQKARNEYSENKNLLLAGSIGPYGAFLADGSEYTGNYNLSIKAFQDFHYPRMKALVEAGVDLFAIETQPNFIELEAITELLERKFSEMTAWIALSIKDSRHLCDGTSLEKVVKYLEQFENISAIGVNCTALENITPALKEIQPLTTKPLVVYPNNGDIYDPISKKWKINPQAKTFSDLVPTWISAGAKIIGGCCRTTPENIREIANVVTQSI
ncbi:homocysteine S-methyltransferase [Liquorilactobacillus hordei]|uniref:homocysteine S-methyltransferase n=1 Tax=Liquorilactobacillus hordei TaxID=468911 RepID=UPI0039EC607B